VVSAAAASGPLGGDLRVRRTVNDEPGELQLALREGCDAAVTTSGGDGHDHVTDDELTALED
jgi:hypothetical protein